MVRMHTNYITQDRITLLSCKYFTLHPIAHVLQIRNRTYLFRNQR
jgi:hypothetical protein